MHLTRQYRFSPKVFLAEHLSNKFLKNNKRTLVLPSLESEPCNIGLSGLVLPPERVKLSSGNARNVYSLASRKYLGILLQMKSWNSRVLVFDFFVQSRMLDSKFQHQRLGVWSATPWYLYLTSINDAICLQIFCKKIYFCFPILAPIRTITYRPRIQHKSDVFCNIAIALYTILEPFNLSSLISNVLHSSFIIHLFLSYN